MSNPSDSAHPNLSDSSDPLPLLPFEGPMDVKLGLPGSKSLTLRDCAIAALADGTSTVRFPGEADDYWRMKECLRRLAIGVDDTQPGQVVIEGRGGQFREGNVELDVGQSAVTTRLMLAMAALRPGTTHLDGHASMRARPNLPLVEALRRLGAEISGPRDGYLPTRVVGSSSLASTVRVPGDVSSQYLTALLVIAPSLPEGLEIEVVGTLTSQPYVALTLQEMQRFGIGVDNDDFRRLKVAPGRYRPGTLAVEGDASAASYFAALVTLHGGRVVMENLGATTKQGDYAFLSLCERLGTRVVRAPRHTEIHAEPGRRRGFDQTVDMTRMPDVAPTLMVMAPFFERPTHLVGLSTLRVKECDRIAAPARELRKLGVELTEGPDFMKIQPLDEAARATQKAVVVDTYHDHRMAMSFGVIGSRIPGVHIRDPGCVAKTYPDYWTDWQRCRASASR